MIWIHVFQLGQISVGYLRQTMFVKLRIEAKLRILFYLWGLPLVLGEDDHVDQGVRIVRILLHGLVESGLGLAVLALGQEGHRLPVQEDRGGPQLINHLLVDVVSLLKLTYHIITNHITFKLNSDVREFEFVTCLNLVPAKSHVCPGLGELGEGGVLVLLLHHLELLLGEVGPVDGEKGLDLEGVALQVV